MTREEAIKILKYLIPIPYRGDSKSTSHLLQTNALVMAIKALEQNSSDDVISREFIKYEYRRRFKENLTDNARGIDLTKYVDSICKEFNAFIDSIPSVNPTKTGHWIPIQELVGVDKAGNEMLVTVGYKCSDCGEKHESKTLYCSHCGTRME